MTAPENTTEREQVLGGMELISWKYAGESWRQFVEEYVPHRVQPRVKLYFGSAVLILVAFLSAPVFVWSALLGIGALIALGLAAVYTQSRSVEDADLAPADAPPAVTITALGIIVGDYARLWRDDYIWLFEAYFRDGHLHLVFETARQSYEGWTIPVPEEMESDIAELVELLRAKSQLAQRQLLPDAPSPGQGPKR